MVIYGSMRLDKVASPVASPRSPSTSPIVPTQVAVKQAEPVKNVDAAPPHVDAKVTPHILHLDNFLLSDNYISPTHCSA